jgi:dienelactone hydrolase
MSFETTISRRRLLAGALAAGSAGALARVPGARAAGAGPISPQPAAPGQTAITFFSDPAINFQLLFTLGAVGYGAAETGEVLATFDRIHARGDSYRAVFEELLALGRQLRKRGDEQRAAGRIASARGCYLRASSYLDQAMFYTLASAQPTRAHEGAVYREMEAAWAAAAALFKPRFEPVRIPYGRSHLPGWMLRGGDDRTRRPTVILNNGSDAQNIDMYVLGGAAALERGWNALIFEGPGQGGNLFLRNIGFRPDWEHVITPIVDWLHHQPGVDSKRISLAGESFAGYLVTRAAAYEHRLAAVVADPGVVDAFVSWSEGLPKPLLEMVYAGRHAEFMKYWNEGQSYVPEAERFQLAKRLEIYPGRDVYEQLRHASKYKLTRRIVGQIDAPMAVLAPELEQFFPGQSQTLYQWLRTSRKALLQFTVAEGAQFHCEPMAPQLHCERVFDWLETNARPVH